VKLPLRRTRTEHTRGQALVEFAVILPLLVLLLVMAIDFGRVFFGWVALQNAARIGSDYAATHADAWDGTPSADEANEQDEYRTRVLEDMQAINCLPPGGGTWNVGDIPDPVFASFDDGALASVTLNCSFGLLTPLAETVFGGPVSIAANSEFAVTRTINTGLPPAPPPPPPLGCDPGDVPVPDLFDLKLQDAFDTWTGDGFSGGNFSPAVISTNKNKHVLTQVPDAGTCADPATATMTVTY